MLGGRSASGGVSDPESRPGVFSWAALVVALAAAGGDGDARGRPIGCGDDAGYGNIDRAPFVDANGRAYLYLSTDRWVRRIGRLRARADDLRHPAQR
jgi:hypothetical protein